MGRSPWSGPTTRSPLASMAEPLRVNIAWVASAAYERHRVAAGRRSRDPLAGDARPDRRRSREVAAERDASRPTAGVRSCSRCRTPTASGTAAPTGRAGSTSRSPSSTHGRRRTSRSSSFATSGWTRAARRRPGRLPRARRTSAGRPTAPCTSRARTSRASTASRSRVGAYFGQAVDRIVDRLLGDQLDDGGWNCWAEYGATVSSFHSTICVLEGLLNGSAPAELGGRDGGARRGEEYLLDRRLFRRRSTGQVVDPSSRCSRSRHAGTTTCCARSTTSATARRRTAGRGSDRPGRRQAGRGWPLAAREHAPGADALRDGGPTASPAAGTPCARCGSSAGRIRSVSRPRRLRAPSTPSIYGHLIVRVLRRHRLLDRARVVDEPVGGSGPGRAITAACEAEICSRNPRAMNSP